MKKWLTSLFTLLTAFALLIGCSNEPTAPQTSDQETAPENTSEVNNEIVVITISKDNEAEVLSEKEVEIAEGDILMDVMKENFDIEEDGGFIHSIEGVSPDEGEEKAWIYYVNGETAMIGAAEYELSAGDHIVFDLQAWE